ncbi:glycosyltransferase family 4 protein [Methanothermococcus thermolithotrophicus]|jgi:glycosyltransferase involved in cell wall biosynthesis|uniref:glycosyltransferase family 4 protein n=1 Tax=Methanothermococcus thermolithotrophicus TaxID=2186 RepID=UPI00036BF2D0|nr:glycosyltransferase family 4 protein [Methanothermococcus thermolithotrophicus]
MKKGKTNINIVLFHSFERKWFLKNNITIEFYENLETHITKILCRLIKSSEFTKYSPKFVFFTIYKEYDNLLLKHRCGFNMNLVYVNLFKLTIPLEISLSLLNQIFNIKKSEVSIWHLNTYYYLIFDFVVPILKLKKQKIIAHHRGGGFSWNPIAIPYSIFQYILMLPILLRLVDKIIVQNKYELNRLIKQYMISPNKIVWIPNGIDIKLFKPLPENERNILRKKFGFNEDEFVILYVGRITKGKGILKLPEIIEKLVNEHDAKKIKFFIIGDGDDKEKLVNALKEKKLLDYVKFSEGFINDINELIIHYNVGDVMVHLNTKSEGSPNVVLEAQACGLPVVGFDIPGVQDSIINGKTGFLIKNKDYEDYAEKLNILYSNKELHNVMKIEARKNIEKNFNIDDIIKKYIEVYNHVQ